MRRALIVRPRIFLIMYRELKMYIHIIDMTGGLHAPTASLSGEKIPHSHYIPIRAWMGPRVGLDSVEEEISDIVNRTRVSRLVFP
jgi:hypothetical protein